MKKLPTLELQSDGTVILPNGRSILAEWAASHGFAVVEAKPSAASFAAVAAAAREARTDALLSLPEAAGKLSSVLYLASKGTPPDLASRLLAGLPLDADAEIPGTAELPPAAQSPADPRAARRAEIAAMGAARRGARA